MVQSNKRQSRRDEVRRWLEEREREDLTYDALSKRSAIPKGTLLGWAVRFRKEARKVEGRAGLARVTVRGGELPDSLVAMVRITLRSGQTVEVALDHEPEAVLQLVKRLEAC